MNLKKQILERLPKGRRGKNICEFDNGYDFGWNACLSDVRKAIDNLDVLPIKINVVKLRKIINEIIQKDIWKHGFRLPDDLYNEILKANIPDDIAQAIAKNIDKIVRVK